MSKYAPDAHFWENMMMTAVHIQTVYLQFTVMMKTVYSCMI